MRTREENYMSMVRTVAQIVRKHQEVWSSVPRFSDYAARLCEVIEQVDAAQEDAEITCSGATPDKETASEQAIHLGCKLSHRAMAYAEDSHLYGLRDQLKINRYNLLNGQAAGTLRKLRDAQQQITAILPLLGDYGVTQQQLTEFTDAIDIYEQLLLHSRETITNRKSHNQVLAQYVKVLRRLLVNMDYLVNNFEDTAFEHDYNNARIIVNLGARHRTGANAPVTTGTLYERMLKEKEEMINRLEKLIEKIK